MRKKNSFSDILIVLGMAMCSLLISCRSHWNNPSVAIDDAVHDDGLLIVSEKALFDSLQGKWSSSGGEVMMEFKEDIVSFHIDSERSKIFGGLGGESFRLDGGLVFKKGSTIYTIFWESTRPKDLQLISREVGRNSLETLRLSRST